MATVSSHILDSTNGDHASGIRAVLNRLDGGRSELVFDAIASDEGRISQQIDLSRFSSEAEFELLLYSAEYFKEKALLFDSPVEVVVIRFRMSDDEGRYHLPVMLSPHSYSTWWSR
ncbi:MAG: hydroxyisourate hydrolase [Pseudomonadota bacterium]